MNVTTKPYVPTVELSVFATSEELKLLAEAAERHRMSLREYLRFQVLQAARMLPATADAVIAPAPLGLAEPTLDQPGRPAFLP
ncbi:MAG: hypothetical protein SFV19_15225 [Rhodospirillaceae bacterium]|nr:hypothetical protein [Rhodospirillaceae bacterium]